MFFTKEQIEKMRDMVKKTEGGAAKIFSDNLKKKPEGTMKDVVEKVVEVAKEMGK